MSRQGSSPPTSPQVHEFHEEFASFEEGYVRSYVALADTKAAWTFTVASGLLAYLFSKDVARQTLLNAEWSPSHLTLLGGVILLILSAFYSSRVVAPRLQSPSHEGIVFFGAVANQPDAQSYVNAVRGYDRQALTEARLKHCYDVAKICQTKYSLLRKAIWFGLPGLVLALGYILIQ